MELDIELEKCIIGIVKNKPLSRRAREHLEDIKHEIYELERFDEESVCQERQRSIYGYRKNSQV